MARKRLIPLRMAAMINGNGRSRTILVVEDEAVIRYILPVDLKRTGHVVLKAGDGQEGLTVWRQFKDQIDLVIADVRPRMGGPTMVRHLQA